MTIEDYIKLCDDIRKWNEEYYVENNTSISDSEYDDMLLQLQEYEAEHPEDVLPDSPSQLVGGGKALTGLTSQQKMFSASEVNAWWKQCGGGGVIAEPKIDGCTLALDYHDGKFVKASLRDGGNGNNDVTDKAQYIGGIPMEINYKKDIQIRGEVYIPLSTFDAINQRQRLNGLNEYANPRNLCAGTMQADNPMLCKERGLKFMLWGWDKCDRYINKYIDTKMFIADLGFNTSIHIEFASVNADSQNAIDYFGKHKTSFDLPIDGIVFKIDNMSLWESIGVTEHHPKYMTAYKFKTEQATVRIVDLYWTVAKSGKITPNANFECARLHGTNVRHATLNNIQWIKDNLGELRHGDELIVTKANEIIPKVLGVKHVGTGELIPIIDRCPMCGGPITHHLKQDGTYGVEDFCDNEECPSRTVARTKSGKVAKKETHPNPPCDGGGKDSDTVTLGDMYDTSALEGKSVVVSGTFNGEYSRKQLEMMVELCSGKLASSVSKKTSFIVAGEGIGPSKRAKAEALGVRIISDEEFINMIKC